MPFTRKFLAALGIEADKIDQIMDAHVDVTDGLKKERDDANAKVTALEEENSNLKSGKTAEYDKLKKEFDDYKAGIAGKEARQAKAQAFTDLLRANGISDKRIGAIVKVTDIDSLELDKDGKIKDEKEQNARIKSEWAEFIETKQTQGAQTATPPTSTGGTVAKTKEEILKIKDDDERQKAWLDYLNNSKGD